MKSLYESILSSTHAGKVSLVRKWLDEHNIKNYTINKKGEIDVDGNVSLIKCGLVEFPSFIQFGTIKGNFYCSYNKLTSLKGAPIEVGKVFDCSFNRLVSLEGAPLRVKYFDCSSNKLTSLEGAPKEVGGSFNCSDNKLTSLEGAPENTGRSFYCDFNILKTLKGAPKNIGGLFDCSNNKLTTLEGAPKKVGGDFYCNNNNTKFTVDDVENVCNVEKKIYV